MGYTLEILVMNNLSITFWGGVGTVTGANFLVTHGNTKMLIDCGMLQGLPEAQTENFKPFPYNPQNINFLFLTHGHIDHIGRVPKLIKDGFRGEIISTRETKEIAELMLFDAARIGQFEKEEGKEPLFEKSHVEKALSLWKTVPLHTKTIVNGGITLELFDAGHILGSSMFLFSFDRDGGKTTKVLFTGDLGNSPSSLLKDTDYVEEADFIVVDSVYGDRNHEPKEEREKIFKEALVQAIRNKGVVLIPAFSLERTQTILYELNELIEGGHIPSIPVFLDSPLAIELTQIYEKISGLYNDKVKDDIKSGDDIFRFPKLKETIRVAESKSIQGVPPPKIIIAGSGMSTAGRILHHETRYLPDPNATLLLMGYQAPGTLGRLLEEGQKKVIIDDKEVSVRAKIIKINGYSAHKDQEHILDFVDHINKTLLKKIFVVMGEPRSSLFLSQRIRDYVGIDAVVPEKGIEYSL